MVSVTFSPETEPNLMLHTTFIDILVTTPRENITFLKSAFVSEGSTKPDSPAGGQAKCQHLTYYEVK
jgi:hypothetical protein